MSINLVYRLSFFFFLNFILFLNFTKLEYSAALDREFPTPVILPPRGQKSVIRVNTFFFTLFMYKAQSEAIQSINRYAAYPWYSGFMEVGANRKI